MRTIQTFFASLSLGLFSCASLANTLPYIEERDVALGLIEDSVVVGLASYPFSSPTTRTLTFSLNEPGEVRVDMRSVNFGNKYVQFRLSPDTHFELFDASAQSLGLSGIDPTFNGDTCVPDMWGGPRCNVGLTWRQQLASGDYTVKLYTAALPPYSNMPNLQFGVAYEDPAITGEYLSRLTPTGAAPEPTTLAFMSMGLAGLYLARRKAAAAS